MNTSPQPHLSPVASATQPPRMENMRPPKAAQSVSQWAEFWPQNRSCPPMPCFVYLEATIIWLPQSFFQLERPSVEPQGRWAPSPTLATLLAAPPAARAEGTAISLNALRAQPNVSLMSKQPTGNSFGTFNLKQNKTYIFCT